jgi:DNA repair protein RadC
VRKITSLPISLRPREKLLKRGVSILSIEELVAVVLNTGTKTQTVSKLSGQVARLIRKRSTITKEALMSLGLGQYKVAQILAALELARRANPPESIKLTSASQVFANSYEIIGQDKETVLCFYLNARGELLKKEIIAVGTLNRASLLPREIFSLVKELPVAAIILVHNHPSGNLEPSKEDILFTKRVKASADILGIQLLDHLIVSKGGWRKIPI